MRRSRSAKIIATLGPASSGPDVMEKLFYAGADVFRFNFSHGSHDEHKARYDALRAIEKQAGRPVGVLLDLQGPKLRVGVFENDQVTVGAGDRFRFDLDPAPGSRDRVQLPHPEIFAALTPGALLLLDDGRLRMQVLSCTPDQAVCQVTAGGVLSNRKGVNVPSVVLPVSPVTEKDRRDLEFGLGLGVDFVALSFVQRPEDIIEARKLIGDHPVQIVSKLEKPQAIEHLQQIIDLSDAIMVARGDLGVEVPPEDVPGLQKRIISSCRLAGKPVIVATQMLDSMVSNPSPTRAEASDVATAIYDGADAVMLSAESAAGHYPVQAVEMMDRILIRVEGDPIYEHLRDAARPAPEANDPDAISAAARQVTHTIGAKAIVSYTTSGSTARRASRERPETAVLGLTPINRTARQLCLVWGLHPVLTRDATNFAEMVTIAGEAARREGFAEPGDAVVITAGIPFGSSGRTNILRIIRITG